MPKAILPALCLLLGSLAPARAQGLQTIRIAINPIEVYAQVYYAKEMGFFAKAGLRVTTLQWARDHPDLVARFAAVMRETALWANRNPQKSGEILVKYVKIDPALLATMNRARFADRLTPALMQPPIDVAAKYAHFDSFTASELIYTAPAR